MNVVDIEINISLNIRVHGLEQYYAILEILTFGEETIDNKKLIELLALDKRPLYVSEIPISVKKSKPGQIEMNDVKIKIIG